MSDNCSIRKIKSLRVKDLQQELQKRGIETCGKKADLVEKLQQALNSSNIVDDDGNTTFIPIANATMINNTASSKKIKKHALKYKRKPHAMTIKKLRKMIINLKKEIKELKSNVTQLYQLSSNKNITVDKTNHRKTKNVNTQETLIVPTNSNNITAKIQKSKVVKDQYNNLSNINNSISKKSRITILADSHGRHLSNILKDKLPDCDIQCIFKPNATWQNVVVDAKNLMADASKCDYVIICAGVNNALKGIKLPVNSLLKTFEQLKHTNVFTLTLPYVSGRPVLNTFIETINEDLYSSCLLCSNVTLINTNKILNAKDYYKSSIHLNYRGKEKLVNAIYKYIRYNQNFDYNNPHIKKHINFRNLINVTTDNGILLNNCNENVKQTATKLQCLIKSVPCDNEKTNDKEKVKNKNEVINNELTPDKAVDGFCKWDMCEWGEKKKNEDTQDDPNDELIEDNDSEVEDTLTTEASFSTTCFVQLTGGKN